MKLNYLKLIIIFFILQNVYADELKYKNLFIEWKSVEGAFGYTVEVINNAGELVISNDVKTSSINIRLPEGDFRLRIGAKNRQNNVESWSDWKNIKIAIKNPPQPPYGLVADKTVFSKYLINIRLAWNPPLNADESEVSYSILKLVDNNYEKVADTKDTEYLFTDLQRGRIYKFMVFSVNKDGEESLKGIEIAVDDEFIPLNILIKGNYIFPLMKFGDLFEYGYGSILNLYFSDIFINNLSAGIESGYLYLRGKDTDDKHLNAESSYIIPACMNISYTIAINNSFSIRPSVSSGYTYNRLKYTDDNNKTQSKIFWDPVFTSGLDFLYKMNYYLAFGIGCQYGILFEFAGNLHFAAINAHADLRFDL